MTECITLDQLAASIKRDRLKKKYDATIAITGWKGKGKSTFAYKLGRKIDNLFEIRRNYVFKAEYDVIKNRVFTLEKESGIIIDEAIDVLYKMDWADDLQNALIKLLTKTRHKHQALFLCIPQFTELRRSFRNYLIDYWVHLPFRGLAIVFGKSPSPFDEDPWHIKENNKAFWEAAKKTSYLRIASDMNMQVDLFEKTPGFITFLTFDEMPEGDQEEFDKLSEEAKEKTTEKSQAVKTNIRYRKALQRMGLLIGLLNHKYHMPQAEIGEILHVKQERISQFLHGVVEVDTDMEQQEVNINAEPSANQNQP
jgi:predicted XRE-type DNA-binding protein